MITQDLTLQSSKTTFMLLGSNNKRLESIKNNIKEKHNVHITKTDLLNIAVDVFLNKIAEDQKVEDYLIQYNKL